MRLLGLSAFIVALTALTAACLRIARPSWFGVPGWVGLSALVTSTAWLASHSDTPAGLVPLAWTGYVLAADSAVFAIRGQSLLRTRPETFAWLAILSVFLWMPFEWYNLQLAGWYRAGLPSGPIRFVLLGWSFACIWPALFETADLLLAVSRSGSGEDPPGSTASIRKAAALIAAGAAFLVVPLLVPRLDLGEHLLALAGAGFLLVLDPWNAVQGRPSLWQDWVDGRRSRLAALAVSGLVCGLFADGLNWLAGLGWHCIWSLGPPLKVFELPLSAYGVLPFFGAQAFAMHVFSTGILGLPSSPVPSFRAGSQGESPVASGSG